MPKATSWRHLVKKLQELGFAGPFIGGRHFFMIRNERKLIIPNRHRGDISSALLKEILRQAGISNNEWEDN